MTRVVLSIGGNLGDREAHIEAMERGLRLILADARVSELMETEPVGVDGPQPPYLNRIVAGYYSGGARQLLEACHAIEARLGRTREKPRGARTADVDILLFGGLEICEGTPPKTLVIPHPQILNRRFCLEGLARIDPNVVVPGLGGGRTAGELLKNITTEVAAQNVFFVGTGYEKNE
jgi:2-amino-4-hydroxy-6-hydroxymethyldihydropteridine diphosphokinase